MDRPQHVHVGGKESITLHTPAYIVFHFTEICNKSSSLLMLLCATTSCCFFFHLIRLVFFILKHHQLHVCLIFLKAPLFEAAPVVDSATQQLLEQNNQLLNQIAANINTFKVCMLICLLFPGLKLHSLQYPKCQSSSTLCLPNVRIPLWLLVLHLILHIKFLMIICVRN